MANPRISRKALKALDEKILGYAMKEAKQRKTPLSTIVQAMTDKAGEIRAAAMACNTDYRTVLTWAISCIESGRLWDLEDAHTFNQTLN